MNIVAVISLTAPLMVALGAAGVSLPIAAHLLNRRARRRIVFPTIRLLRESSASQSRLFKVRRLLLLLLRCLAVLLIAYAFARPVWSARGTPPVPKGQGAAVVLVIDNSASSVQQIDGIAAIQTLRAMAERALDTLRAGDDMVNVIFAEARPRAMFPQLTMNVEAVRQDLGKLRPTYERAALPEAIAMAGQFLAVHPGPKRLVILSDMQKTNWQDVSLAGATGQLLPAGTHVTAVTARGGRQANTALSAPRADPARPIVNQPVQLVVTVTNFAGEARSISVDASVAGRSIESQEVRLEPWQARDVAFTTRLDSRGGHSIVFSTPADSFDADNHAYLALTAAQRVPVLLVSDDDVNAAGSSGYFLARALAPRGDGSDELAVRHVTSAAMDSAAVNAAEAVFIGDVGAMPAEALAAARDYVQRGGGVVMFCGGGPVNVNLKALAALATLAPFEPITLRDVSGPTGGLRITRGAWGAKLLSDFDERSQAALAQVQFHKVWSVSALKPGAVAQLTYSDGTPALASQTAGAGKFVLANFSPALGASDLGKYGAFVALVQSLARDLRPSLDRRTEAVVGQPFSVSLAAPASSAPGDDGKGAASPRVYSVVGPDEREQPVQVTSQASGVVVNLARPALPGFYRVQRDGHIEAVAAINLDPRESDLRRTEPDAIGKQLEGPGVSIEMKSQDDAGPVLQVRGRPLWHWFVAAAMLALGIEMALLLMWKR